MKTINNKLDFEKIYPYQSIPPGERYPTSYPCLGEVMTFGGGLMGEYDEVMFLYPPENVDFATWAKGVQDGFDFAIKYE